MTEPGGVGGVGRSGATPPDQPQGTALAPRNPEGGRSMSYTFTHNGHRATVPIYAFGDQALADRAIANGYVRLDTFSQQHGAAFPNEAAGILVPPDVALQYLASMEPQPAPTDQGLVAVVGGGRSPETNPNVGNPLFRGTPEPGGAPRGTDTTPVAHVEAGEATIIRRPTIRGLGYDGNGSISGSHYRTSPEGGYQVRVSVPRSSRPGRSSDIPSVIYVNPSDIDISLVLRQNSESVEGMPGVSETFYRLETPR